MKTPINAKNIASFALSNVDLMEAPVRGIILDLHGLNGGIDMGSPWPIMQECAKKGIVYAAPYDNPWSWMNDMAVRYVDEIVDAFFARFDLPEGTPVVVCGGSMGGLSSLIYTRYAKRTPVACAAICPVCDLPYHYTERPDLPRTIYQAYMHYDGELEAAMQTASPYHQAANMPQIPYLIIHGDADTAVNKGMHSDRFVAELKKTHDDVTYIEVPGAGHCELKGESHDAYFAFITNEKWFTK